MIKLFFFMVVTLAMLKICKILFVWQREASEKAHLFLIGQGDEYEMVNEAINKYQLENLTLMPSVSQDKYMKYVTSADIGLFSLSKAHTAHNFPGKLLGYMVESKPILGSGIWVMMLLQ